MAISTGSMEPIWTRPWRKKPAAPVLPAPPWPISFAALQPQCWRALGIWWDAGSFEMFFDMFPPCKLGILHDFTPRKKRIEHDLSKQHIDWENGDNDEDLMGNQSDWMGTYHEISHKTSLMWSLDGHPWTVTSQVVFFFSSFYSARYESWWM